MNIGVIGAVLAIGAVVASACSNGAQYASACPEEVLPDCPVAPGAKNCPGPELGCGLDALPTGLACPRPEQCSMPIAPCPDRLGRVDGYVCSCIDGRWACDDCWMGASICDDGPDGALLPAFQVDAAPDGPDAPDAPASLNEYEGDAALADAPSSTTADAAGLARCLISEGDAGVIYTATVGVTGNEDNVSPSAAFIEWMDDAGASESCGPSTCTARCPPGHECDVAFISHGLVLSGGTCL